MALFSSYVLYFVSEFMQVKKNVTRREIAFVGKKNYAHISSSVLVLRETTIWVIPWSATILSNKRAPTYHFPNRNSSITIKNINFVLVKEFFFYF